MIGLIDQSPDDGDAKIWASEAGTWRKHGIGSKEVPKGHWVRTALPRPQATRLLSHQLTMPSRSNPNTPSSQKRKAASALKSKRRHTQRLAHNKITKPTPRTSQAIRKAAPLSKKKARKVEKKINFARKKHLEEELGEVEMRDVEKEGKNMREKKENAGEQGDDEMRMDVDEVT